ncbi:MAG: class I SAM-dependent methyltransferase [Planctomycetota bacterium]|jgi:SAM-dependent methyltransferase
MSTVLSRVVDGLMSSPLGGLLARVQGLWTACNEWLLRVDTRPRAADRPDPSSKGVTDSRHGDGLWYAAPDYRYLRQIMRKLDPGDQDVFYDIGCGMGRVLCVAARGRISKVVGIDLDGSLCEIARYNADRMSGRKATIDVRCEDASSADLSDGTIYYLHNPFGPETMRDVLGCIHRSLESRPRPVRIVYHNSVHEDLLRDCEWLELSDVFETLRGQRITFWRASAA